jgi:long-subunit acyl-CoA synthetase (AMP-forming)
MNPADRPTLRTLTQAGGHLKIDHVKHFNELASAKGVKFFVMYGQTEATARISYVPAERLAEKLGSIGVAIPGGKLWLEPVEGDASAQQLYYSGPNVMLGYASEPADLARGDDQNGGLATGDLAECDMDGYFRITGRLARFAKLFGKRINLASIEVEVEQHFGVRVAVIDGGDRLKIFFEGETAEATGGIKAHLASLLGVPPFVIQPTHVGKLPITASGKKDYKVLR